ncbi:1,2-phenylacetyl-CoA epoxidase subunit PaaD [Streptomyces sp. NPDC015139]|uniref:1,2-phenylacetyl-CoA epoxidase subunit PaaD n=1 Tax=Streptomyces sp. NPDC015139 TaxID=3364942 RepID=UPI003702BD0B
MNSTSSRAGIQPAPTEEIRTRLEALPDPELPVLTLGDLGLIHAVFTEPSGRLVVEYMPTFLGCPALSAIASSITQALAECGYPDTAVRQVLTPAWSTDRIGACGRRKLVAHGIVPPASTDAPAEVRAGLGSLCPNCGSRDTQPHSLFGPTRCQSMLRCANCRETFAYLITV